ncbi:MAG: FecCD family ABC transporter permease [Pseudomonadota bacterium]
MNSKRASLLFFLILIVLGVPWFGAEPLQTRDVFKLGTLSHRIFWELRIPRLLITVALGGVLATVGCTYQSLFKNPLCEPYILGISSAVLLGIISAETFFHQQVGTLFSVSLGLGSALLLIFVLMAFSTSVLASSDRVILFGMGANFILSSLLFLLLSFQTQSVGGGTLKWFFGFLPWLELRDALIFFFASSLFSIILMIFSRPLEALRMGDSVARTLGVSPLLARNSYLLFTSLVVAITVSFSGTIGFVGLAVPQLCKILFRPASMRSLFVQSFFVGAIFLSIADGISRALIPPVEFPIGVITTLIGGPLFLLTLWKRT